jgi:hypothetical protein
MALLTLEGIYRDGKIELAELPPDTPAQARVIVTFLPASDTNGERGDTQATEALTREEARQRAFARMKKGYHLGGPPYSKRDELYDRFDC